MKPTPDELLLFPPRFLGYSTEEKIWDQFAVHSTNDVPAKNLDLFQKIQLDQNYKDMIRALVEEHGDRNGTHDGETEKVRVKDVVENKGKGLVLLLHGKYYVKQNECVSKTSRSPRCGKNGYFNTTYNGFST